MDFRDFLVHFLFFSFLFFTAPTMASPSANTQKQLAFQKMTMRAEDRSWHSLEVVPGIGKQTQEKLGEIGFSNVSQLLGQFLLFNCDIELMGEWIKERVPNLASDKRLMVANALKDWVENNL